MLRIAKYPFLSILAPLGLGLGLSLVLLFLPGAFRSSQAQTTTAIRYVAPAGADGGNTCLNSAAPCTTIQHAVDMARSGDEIRVAAGTYADVSVRSGLTQVVFIDKSLVVRGGYNPPNWSQPNPTAYPATLDAQGQGRVVLITGPHTVNVEGLRLTGGCLTGFHQKEGYGAGLAAFTATVILHNNVVYNNSINRIGAGLYLAFNRATLSGNTIADNTGEGIFLAYSQATLTGNLIHNNEQGVVVYESPAVLVGNTIASNTIRYNGGSGILVFLSKDVVVENNLITGNVYTGDQVIGPLYCTGGICLVASEAILRDNTISHNQAGWGPGGGLGAYLSTVRLHRNSIISNTSLDRGGGVYVTGDSRLLIDQSLIMGNEAFDAAGLYLEHSQASLTNTVIADNRATVVGGIALWSSSAHFRHTTIARNHGLFSGLYLNDFDPPSSYGPSSASLTNTILAGHNTAIFAGRGSTATLVATLWGSGEWANGTDWTGEGGVITGSINLWAGPFFAHPDGGNYHLLAGSAALDRGIDAGIDTDIDDQPRPYGLAPDLGADEGQPALLVSKRANAEVFWPGDVITYTVYVSNTGYIDLHATITDTLPEQVSPGGFRSWTATIPAAGGVWVRKLTATVEADYIGPLTNILQVTSEEGALGSFSLTSKQGGSFYLPVIRKGE